ncbi:colanic acid exporter [Halomonas lysinitropha]|uniref:Colanic acid exporter n=2 Tax=Halomonas lysinitropha TaxID=2607506 RepID=A0A5K1I9Q8_9GAMM|nr:colanic acid exporter [Halomonas lysinitropha]
MLAVFVSIVSLFSVVAGLKYELAIPLPEDERDAAALTILSLILIFAVAVISALCLYWWGDTLAEAMETPDLAGYLWLVPIAIVFTGMYKLFTYWAVRLKEFPIIAKTKIRQQVVTIAAQVSMFNMGGLGLLVGNVVGTGMGVLTLSTKVFGRKSWDRQPVRRVGYVSKRYRKFPIFSTWGGFLNTAGAQLPPLLFASTFGAGYAGFYALAHRLIAMPMGLVGQAVGQVFLSDAPAQYRSGELHSTLNQAHKILIKCILPPTAILILFGPSLFSVIFGEEWKVSGEVASWLSLWMLMTFTTSPLSSVFMVAEKQHLGMLMQAVLLVARVFGIGIGVIYDDFILAVVWFSIFNVLGYIIYQIVSFKVVGISWYVPLKNYVPAFILLFILNGLGQIFDIGASKVMFVAVVLFSAVYYIALTKELRPS